MDSSARVPASPSAANGQRDDTVPVPAVRATPYEVARLVATLSAYDGVAGSAGMMPDLAGLAKMATFALWGREVSGPLSAVEPPVGTPPGMIDALAAARGEAGVVLFDGPAGLAAVLGAEVARAAGERAQAAHVAAVAGDDAMAILFAEAALRCDPDRPDLQALLVTSRTRIAGMGGGITMAAVAPAPSPAAVAGAAGPEMAPAVLHHGSDDAVVPGGPDPAGDAMAAGKGRATLPGYRTPDDAMGLGSGADEPGAGTVGPVIPMGGTVAPAGPPPVDGALAGTISAPLAGAALPPLADERPSLADVQAMERLLGVSFGITPPSEKPPRSRNDPRLVLVCGIILFVAAMVIGLLVLGTF